MLKHTCALCGHSAVTVSMYTPTGQYLCLNDTAHFTHGDPLYRGPIQHEARRKANAAASSRYYHVNKAAIAERRKAKYRAERPTVQDAPQATQAPRARSHPSQAPEVVPQASLSRPEPGYVFGSSPKPSQPPQWVRANPAMLANWANWDDEMFKLFDQYRNPASPTYDPRLDEPLS